jgi:hypothetical protein
LRALFADAVDVSETLETAKAEKQELVYLLSRKASRHTRLAGALTQIKHCLDNDNGHESVADSIKQYKTLKKELRGDK